MARVKSLRAELKRAETGLNRITRAIVGGAGGLQSLVTEGKRLELRRTQLQVEIVECDTRGVWSLLAENDLAGAGRGGAVAGGEGQRVWLKNGEPRDLCR